LNIAKSDKAFHNILEVEGASLPRLKKGPVVSESFVRSTV